MASDRQQRALLGGLGVILAAMAAYALWPSSPATSGGQTSNMGRRAAASAPQASAPDVHIATLTSEKPKPDQEARDLFKFKPKAPPPAPPRPVEPQRPAAVAPPPPRPQGPPPPPPITLKFVGYLDAPGGKKIASLSDGRGVLIAREGDTVLGQYKIWRIGVESIDISYLDGRGRTTIRMTGQ
ncbi:MAG TPA: hypothetical protein VHZ73_02815 [Vicinamibacterales bacterium]|jgi:hypothetical protein|nr:hypothetical protein [Vicinamibacterales bacterium]